MIKYLAIFTPMSKSRYFPLRFLFWQPSYFLFVLFFFGCFWTWCEK